MPLGRGLGTERLRGGGLRGRGKPISKVDDRLRRATQAAWERCRNITRTQQVRDLLSSPSAVPIGDDRYLTLGQSVCLVLWATAHDEVFPVLQRGRKSRADPRWAGLHMARTPSRHSGPWRPCRKVSRRMSEPIGPPQPTHVWLRHVGMYWLPPLLWVAVMFVLSTDTFAAEHTGEVLWQVLSGLAPHVTYEQYTLLHFLTRKAAHLTEYAILACLLLRAFRAGAAEAWHWRWATLAFVLVAMHAGLDEYHQAYTQYRTGSVSDSVLDIAGGLIALALLWLNRRKPASLDRHRAV